MTLMGNSGFEYILKNVTTNTRQKKLQCTIRDVKTKENIKIFVGSGGFKARSSSVRPPGTTASCKILGYDKYYYYLQITKGTTFSWGQVQSDGAVLKSDRTILRIIPFFPNYKKPETIIPVKTPIIITKPPNIPKIVTIPKTTLSTKTAIGVIPDTPPVKDEISWIQKIIKKIIDWMKTILNR